ncbi:uncharacterized protein TNCV_4159281 [Trichonephila clavipes]|nr:uncharacterized protein TNCV_4159281 [Trichonephila clavipes]
MREYRAWKKTLQNTLLMPSLRDGNAIETLLMTTQINTDFVNHPVPSTTEHSTSLGIGLNPGENMNVCKCIVPLRHGGTLNSRRAASPLVWLMKGEREVGDPWPPTGFSPF